MQLRTAALRVLIPALQDGSNADARREFARNQLELSYQERLMSGRGSSLRTLAYLTAADDQSAAFIARNILSSAAILEKEAVAAEAHFGS